MFLSDRFSNMMLTFTYERLHRTTKKSQSKGGIQSLKTFKNLRKTMVFQWLLSKTIVKHKVFATLGLPDPSPDDEKPKKNNGFLMVAIKKHCKTHGFGNFCSPKFFSKTSPKPLQKRFKIEILKS